MNTLAWILIGFLVETGLNMARMDVLLNDSQSSPERETQCKQVIYNSIQLNSIRARVKHHNVLKMIPNDVVVTIRSLKLQKKRKRGRRRSVAREEKVPSNCSDKYNLVTINTENDIKPTKSNLSLGLINTQSVRNKELVILREMEINNINICALTETWLTDSDHDNLWMSSTDLNSGRFRMQTVNRIHKKGGGVGLIWTESLRSKLIKSGIKDTFEYGLWRLSSGIDSLHIMVVYHPPAGEKGKTNGAFLDEFCDLVAEVSMECENLIYTGDFNIRINDENDQDAQQLKDLTEALGLKQHVMGQTHSKGNTLDLIFTELNSTVGIRSVAYGAYVSDHRLVVADLSLKEDRMETKSQEVRNFKDLNTDEFFADMNLNELLNESMDDIDKLLENFVQSVNRSLDTHAPLTSIKNGTKDNKMWFNKELREQRKIVRSRQDIFRKYKLDHHWQAYKVERNKYTKILRDTKKKFLKLEFEKLRGNTKGTYALVNKLTGSTTSNPMPESNNNEKLANDFADFFIGKIEKIRQALNQHQLYTVNENYDGPLLEEFRPFTEKEVKKLMGSMQTKSCESDPLPTKFIKEHIDSFLPILTKFINVSLKNGSFAEDWKLAILRPLLKKAGLELIHSNYRPVSNLAFLSKLVEKAMISRFKEHLDQNNLNSIYQSAYRANHSCETLVLKLVNDLLWKLEDQQACALVAIDLSAAFDTVNHQVALTVLRDKYGVTGIPLKWFESYLRDRRFKVSIEEVFSREVLFNFSVPQGSIIGPRLFCVYSSTLETVISNDITMSAFADDHTLYKGYNPKDQTETDLVMRKLETTLQDVQTWMSENRLKMNASKSEFVIFSSKRLSKHINTNSLNVAGDDVKIGDNIRLLGAWLDRFLTMEVHARKKAKAASLALMKIRHIRQYITDDICKLLVNALVTSHVDYCNGILAGCSNKVVNILQRIQTQAAKLILNRRKWESSSKALRDLHWLPVRKRICYKILVTVFNCLQGNAPRYLMDLLVKNEGTRTLRNSHNKLIVPSVKRKTFASRSFSVYGPRVWNRLPEHLRLETNRDNFKRKLKTFLFDCNDDFMES